MIIVYLIIINRLSQKSFAISLWSPSQKLQKSQPSKITVLIKKKCSDIVIVDVSWQLLAAPAIPHLLKRCTTSDCCATRYCATACSCATCYCATDCCCCAIIYNWTIRPEQQSVVGAIHHLLKRYSRDNVVLQIASMLINSATRNMQPGAMLLVLPTTCSTVVHCIAATQLSSPATQLLTAGRQQRIPFKQLV